MSNLFTNNALRKKDNLFRITKNNQTRPFLTPIYISLLPKIFNRFDYSLTIRTATSEYLQIFQTPKNSSKTKLRWLKLHKSISIMISHHRVIGNFISWSSNSQTKLTSFIKIFPPTLNNFNPALIIFNNLRNRVIN